MIQVNSGSKCRPAREAGFDLPQGASRTQRIDTFMTYVTVSSAAPRYVGHRSNIWKRSRDCKVGDIDRGLRFVASLPIAGLPYKTTRDQ
jgi:hypothetical protein